ncbi:MAG TPA: hypothetical protein VKT70_09725 [Stellaceae bacterium]|nr:hypothetical protein [Stellaceae bacterium]
MARPNGIFDRTHPVRRPPYRRLLREVWSLAAEFPTPPDPADLPQGRGHVVLIVPGLLSTDTFTSPLRGFLRRCGYRSFGWGLGMNVGPTKRALRGLRARIRELRLIEGGPISIVGVSVGGVLARDAAYDCREDIRQIITLSSPFHLPTASTVEPVFHLCTLFHSSAVDLARLATPLPVRSTAIFTRDDGIVARESCWTEAEASTSIEVRGAHMTLGRNPSVLRLVAERLGSTPLLEKALQQQA